VLLCTDEVITGFGRTGRMWGLEHWGVEPDMIQYAKAITSGYFPLGGTGVSDKIADVLDSGEEVWMHAYTYSAHPVGCAVAMANLDIIQSEDFPTQAAEKGRTLLDGLKQRLDNHPHVGEVRGLGLMVAVEIVEDRQTKAEFDADEKVGARINQAMQNHGLFSRMRGDVVCLAPPIVITDQELEQVIDAVTNAIGDVLGA
jgi:adenosylmethionine-8-amino-7-oxononanoate aminotransferase